LESLKSRYKGLRGRFGASRTALVPDIQRELLESMCRIAETDKGPARSSSRAWAA
jgi:hypothetical protein